MRLPQLDDRLSRAAALFPACAYGADIGADHGRLSCVLLARGVCQRMCVADISAPSLKKAEQLLRLHSVADRADIRVGDGLKVLDRPAEAIAILGMGGRSLSGILLKGRDRLMNACLVLSAHTELPLLRRTVSDIGYRIETELVARAGGRFYVVMRAFPGAETYSERQLLLGPRLMECTDDLYLDYLSWRIGMTGCKQSEEARIALEWLKEEEKRVRDCTNDRRIPQRIGADGDGGKL